MKARLFPHVVLLSSALPFCTFAAPTHTWTGNGGDNNWTTPGNWQPTGVPATGDFIVFNGRFQNPVTVNMNFFTFKPSSISFTNNVTCQLSGSGVLLVGASNSCATLSSTASLAEWQRGTSLSINGALG